MRQTGLLWNMRSCAWGANLPSLMCLSLTFYTSTVRVCAAVLDGITTSSSKHAETPADRLQMGFILHGLITGSTPAEEDDELPVSPAAQKAHGVKESEARNADQEPKEEAAQSEPPVETVQHVETGTGPDRVEITEVTETSDEL